MNADPIQSPTNAPTTSPTPGQTLIPGFREILHGGDYNPEQWLKDPSILAEDRRLRRLAGCRVFTVGVFSWSHLEPREGVYDFSWFDRVMDELAEDGCKAIVATPSAARPPWMARRYPEVMRTGRNRQRELFNGRHNFCWSSPVYREKVQAINERLAERYRSHPALGMWHISNELGGHQNNGECFCELCLARWYRWLEERYGTIEALHEAWWAGFWSHQYTCWEEIQPDDPTLPACALDWSRFVNQTMKEWIEFEAGILRRITPGVPITTNFMGVHPWIDYAELATAVDVISDDQYPGLTVDKPDPEGDLLGTAFKHDLQRNYHPDRPFFLMESCPETPQWHVPQGLKHEHLHRAEMLQAIGHGAEGTCYFQWRKGRGGMERLHGAVVDHAGTEHTRTFGLVRRLSQTYEDLKPVLGSRRPASIAVLYDHDTRGVHQLGTSLQGSGETYLRHAQEHYRVFWKRGLPIDVMDSRRRWEDHRLVIAPLLYLLQEGVAQRIRHFVEQGGIFVATTMTGCVDASIRSWLGGWPGDGLQEVFGVWDEETDHLPLSEKIVVQSVAPEATAWGTAHTVISVVHATQAEVTARFADGPRLSCGRPAILQNTFGKGTAFYLAGCLDRTALGHFYDEVLDLARLSGPFAEELPPGVIFSSRKNSQQEFWVLANLSARPQQIKLREASLSATLLTGQGTWEDDGIFLPAHADAVWRVPRTDREPGFPADPS